MKTLSLAIVLLLLPRPSWGEDTAFRASMVAAVLAHSTDLAVTEFCLGSGRCREVNPLLARFTAQPAAFAVVKMGIATAQLWALAHLHKTHPKWATGLNLATAAFFTGVTVRNMRVVP